MEKVINIKRITYSKNLEAGHEFWKRQLIGVMKRNWWRPIVYIFFLFLVYYFLHWSIVIITFFSLLGLIIVYRNDTLKSFHKAGKEGTEYFPNGYNLCYTDLGFFEVAISGQRWPMKNWEGITRYISLPKSKGFVLYNDVEKSYHLFFEEEMSKEEYSEFIFFVQKKIRNNLAAL